MFTFNKNYHDKEQVRDFLLEFTALKDQMKSQGQYPYNSCFVGKIPGIEGASEETAIYLLQNLYDIEEEKQRMAELRAELESLTKLDTTTKFSKIVAYRAGHYVGGRGLVVSISDGRIVPKDGKPYAILPKGKRTNGYMISGYEVLVSKASGGQS